MSETLNTTETRRPAKLSPPSDRDLEIYKHAEIHHRTHDAIASDFGITRRRVGQIVQEVHRWLSIHGTLDPEINTDAKRQRLARGMERMRLEDILQRAVHALNNAPLTLSTCTHVNYKLQNKIDREQPPVDPRLLNTYLRTVLALGKLDERKPLPAPLPVHEPWKDPNVQNLSTDLFEKFDIEWDTPDQHQEFLQEFSLIILSSLAESLSGSGVVCGEDDPSPTDEPPQSTPDPLPSLSPDDADPTSPPTPHSALRIPHFAASASHASLPEAPTGESPFTTSNDESSVPPNTCDQALVLDSTSNPPHHPLQNPEKGSAQSRPMVPIGHASPPTWNLDACHSSNPLVPIGHASPPTWNLIGPQPSNPLVPATPLQLTPMVPIGHASPPTWNLDACHSSNPLVPIGHASPPTWNLIGPQPSNPLVPATPLQLTPMVPIGHASPPTCNLNDSHSSNPLVPTGHAPPTNSA